MAVYTQLEIADIEALISPLRLGRLMAVQGVAAGVENTTYFLDFDGNSHSQNTCKYVLTIAEGLERHDLAFIASFMRDLGSRDLPVPAPVACGADAVLMIKNKPALLVPRIKGTHPQAVTPRLCRSMGELLGRLHTAALTLGYRRESHRSLAWVETTGHVLLTQLNNADRNLLNQELELLSSFVSANKSLPQAVIHGDLFRDNVLIDDGSITGVIDFFSAGLGYLLFDLAIVVNDWCFDADTSLNLPNYRALIEGYWQTREPQSAEIQCWSQLLRIAALRFWVSRLNERLIASPHAPLGRGKDPAPYQRLIARHHAQPLLMRS